MNDKKKYDTADRNRPENETVGGGLRKIDAAEIMKGDNAVCIEFEGMQYILRITSNRKLILTK